MALNPDSQTTQTQTTEELKDELAYKLYRYPSYKACPKQLQKSIKKLTKYPKPHNL